MAIERVEMAHPRRNGVSGHGPSERHSDIFDIGCFPRQQLASHFLPDYAVHRHREVTRSSLGVIWQLTSRASHFRQGQPKTRRLSQLARVRCGWPAKKCIPIIRQSRSRLTCNAVGMRNLRRDLPQPDGDDLDGRLGAVRVMRNFPPRSKLSDGRVRVTTPAGHSHAALQNQGGCDSCDRSEVRSFRPRQLERALAGNNRLLRAQRLWS